MLYFATAHEPLVTFLWSCLNEVGPFFATYYVAEYDRPVAVFSGDFCRVEDAP